MGGDRGISPGYHDEAVSTRVGGGGFSVVVEPQGNVRVAGEIDIATAPALQEAIESASSDRDGDVVVDLGSVDFIDSSGMNVFVRCYKPLEAAGRALVLRRPSPTVRRALDAGGITTFLRVE